eukprot:1760089-Alexandrium_andersonii.AAC.1
MLALLGFFGHCAVRSVSEHSSDTPLPAFRAGPPSRGTSSTLTEHAAQASHLRARALLREHARARRRALLARPPARPL